MEIARVVLISNLQLAARLGALDMLIWIGRLDSASLVEALYRALCTDLTDESERFFR